MDNIAVIVSSLDEVVCVKAFKRQTRNKVYYHSWLDRNVHNYPFQYAISLAPNGYYNEVAYYKNEGFKLITFEKFKSLYMEKTTKLEITKEKVLEAASKCPQAKETLRTLFPEVFEPAKIKFGGSIDVYHDDSGNKSIISIRGDGMYAHRGLFLPEAHYKWVIYRDDQGKLVLLPTHKDGY